MLSGDDRCPKCECWGGKNCPISGDEIDPPVEELRKIISELQETVEDLKKRVRELELGDVGYGRT